MLAIVAIGLASTPALSQSSSGKTNAWTQLKSELRFDPASVSIGVSPSFMAAPDPANFTLEEYADFRGSNFDATLAVNVWRNLNLRAGIGYLTTLKAEKYFDTMFPAEEVWGVYDDIYGGVGKDNFFGLGGSNVYVGLGFSRSLYFGKFHITPVYMRWFGSWEENYAVEGYQIIATGEIVNERVLVYEGSAFDISESLGVDVEFSKHILGLYLQGGFDNMNGFCVRYGYKLWKYQGNV